LTDLERQGQGFALVLVAATLFLRERLTPVRVAAVLLAAAAVGLRR